MPSKKKKYNARFPAGRIKKIMQTDDEVGKVAQAVPVIISRTLELFVESLLTKAQEITSAKNAKTLSPSHMKQCILSESRFDFLKELVANFPDSTNCDFEEGNFPSVISSPIGSNHSSNDAPSSNAHKKEKSIPNLVPVSSRKASTDVITSPATSKAINANFYRENEHVPSASNSTSSMLNSSNFGEELDEDYDTT